MFSLCSTTKHLNMIDDFVRWLVEKQQQHTHIFMKNPLEKHKKMCNIYLCCIIDCLLTLLCFRHINIYKIHVDVEIVCD